MGFFLWQITIPAWRKFANELHETKVGYMYVSEHHLLRTNLKVRMRAVIRANRTCVAGPHPPFTGHGRSGFRSWWTSFINMWQARTCQGGR